VYSEKCTASLEMAFESPLGGVDAALGAGAVGLSDVDDNQVRLTGVGQRLLDGLADGHLMAEPGDNIGHAL
jgi:hypothetical protein